MIVFVARLAHRFQAILVAAGEDWVSFSPDFLVFEAEGNAFAAYVSLGRLSLHPGWIFKPRALFYPRTAFYEIKRCNVVVRSWLTVYTESDQTNRETDYHTHNKHTAEYRIRMYTLQKRKENFVELEY